MDSPNIVRTFEKSLGHFFQALIFTTIAICPSHIETRGSFATILDGKCGLIDWLAFYLITRLELVDQWNEVGYFFCCYWWPLYNLLAMESGCSGNDGTDKLFGGKKKTLSFCCFLVAIKFFSHFISECQCKYAVCFEMKSREDTMLTGCDTYQALLNKTLFMTGLLFSE